MVIEIINWYGTTTKIYILFKFNIQIPGLFYHLAILFFHCLPLIQGLNDSNGVCMYIWCTLESRKAIFWLDIKNYGYMHSPVLSFNSEIVIKTSFLSCKVLYKSFKPI